MQTVKEESYQAIFRKYYPRMYYYAKRIVGEDAADDVVQEGFLELWNRMDALDTEGPQIESYLYKTVYSRALNLSEALQKDQHCGFRRHQRDAYVVLSLLDG